MLENTKFDFEFVLIIIGFVSPEFELLIFSMKVTSRKGIITVTWLGDYGQEVEEC